MTAAHAGILIAVLAALVGSGGLGGVIVAKTQARAAATSKPHELITVEQSGFVAFMAEARAEIARLRQRVAECEARHEEQHAEIVRLRAQVVELERKAGP